MSQQIRIDITPRSSMTEEALKQLGATSIGKPFRNERGEVIGEIRSVKVEGDRLIAEVRVNPGVILG